MTISSNHSSVSPITNPSLATSQTFEVNTIQTTSSKQLGGKKKNKGKYKIFSSKQGGEQTKQPINEPNNTKVKSSTHAWCVKRIISGKIVPILLRSINILRKVVPLLSQ